MPYHLFQGNFDTNQGRQTERTFSEYIAFKSRNIKAFVELNTTGSSEKINYPD